MAIGAGTVLMPVEIGLKGIWVFITRFYRIALSILFVRDVYLKRYLARPVTIIRIVSVTILAKTLGIFLGVIYFLMIIHGGVYLFLSVVFDSASYIKTFGGLTSSRSFAVYYHYKVAIFRRAGGDCLRRGKVII